MKNLMRIKSAVCYSFDLNHEGAFVVLRLIGPLRRLGINIVNELKIIKL